MANAWRGPVSIPDARGGDAAMRVSWHGTHRKVVVSHWHGGVCTASTAMDVEEVPRLVAALVAALGWAASNPPTEVEGGSGLAEPLRRVWRAVVRRVHRELAAVVPISAPPSRREAEHRSPGPEAP